MAGPIDPTTGQPTVSQFASGTSQQVGNTSTTGAQTGNTVSVGQSGTNQANTYTPGQQALQGQVGGAIGSVLSNGGSIPGLSQDFIPQQTQAYVDNYNRYVAPQESAQGGAGSPAIASNLALGLEQLQGQEGQMVYQTNAGTFNNALGTGASTAYNPVGYGQTSNTSTNTASAANTAQNTQSSGAANWQENNDQLLGKLTALTGGAGSFTGGF